MYYLKILLVLVLLQLLAGCSNQKTKACTWSKKYFSCLNEEISDYTDVTTSNTLESVITGVGTICINKLGTAPSSAGKNITSVSKICEQRLTNQNKGKSLTAIDVARKVFDCMSKENAKQLDCK